jgi:hypothetical protein
MNETFVPYLATLAVVNVLAIASVVALGRERRRRPAAPPGPVIAEAPAANAAEPAGDPLEDLVREVEKAEAAARGEARLAQDLARWRRRAAGGDALPRTAGSGRAGAPGQRPERVA